MSDIAIDAPPAGPLTEAVDRVSALYSYLEFRIGLPDEDAWWRVADLADAGLLAGWLDEVEAHFGERRVAGSYMSNWLLRVLAGLWAVPVLAAERLPLSGLDDVAVRRNPGGWFDGAALGREAAGALPGDPALACPDTVAFTGRAALLDALVERLSGLEPVILALREACPVGLNALWGIVADSVANQALEIARLTGRDQEAAWRDVEAIIDRLAALQPRLRARPRAFPVSVGPVIHLFEVRGTCCLYYRTVVNPDRDGEGYCETCPLRTDESRPPRLRALLDG